MKQFVYMVINKSERGFTLLSMLITITVLFTTLPLLAHLIKSVNYSTNYDEISIQQFFQFLRNEFIMATDYHVSENRIILHLRDGKKVSFEKYQNVILRQVGGEGHDIYLRDVAEISFSSRSYGAHVAITSLQGVRYEKTIVFYE